MGEDKTYHEQLEDLGATEVEVENLNELGWQGTCKVGEGTARSSGTDREEALRNLVSSATVVKNMMGGK